MEAFSVVSRLREAKRNLDELMVRHRIGEVSDKEYISNYTALMSELSVLEREAVKAEFQYNHLKRVIGEFVGGRHSSLREQIEKCYERLPRMIEEQNIIDVEIAETVKRDLELIMQVLETLGHERSGGLVESEAALTLERVPGYPEEDFFDEELIFRKVTSVVKGHDDEIRRIIRAIKMRDNVLIIGRHAEGKTELLLQLHKCLGGIYFHCHEEVSERELIAGFNPSAFVGVNPVHMGCLMQIVSGEVKGLPIAFIDEIMKLRPKTQIILFEAMNNKRFLNPVDGKTYYLPPEFSVVSSSNIESVVQETPDIAFLDRFGKIIMWRDTPDDAVREILKPYGLPSRVVDLILWVRRQVAGMRYLVPVSIRNLQKLALEYNRYRSTYRNPEELKKLIIDRLLKVRVLNVFGLREFEEAKKKIEQYIGERLGGVV
ncbi:MAG: ATPase [Candidatus Bathyarchaeota archaeon B26-1]|nr:MAG: ATPase [Candidatus Bathyarchaeota archaeon B26-1]